MATQILDTELDVARKYLHFNQRDLYRERFIDSSPDPRVCRITMGKIKYWRARYNSAMAIEQEREESNVD